MSEINEQGPLPVPEISKQKIGERIKKISGKVWEDYIGPTGVTREYDKATDKILGALQDIKADTLSSTLEPLMRTAAKANGITAAVIDLTLVGFKIRNGVHMLRNRDLIARDQAEDLTVMFEKQWNRKERFDSAGMPISYSNQDFGRDMLDIEKHLLPQITRQGQDELLYAGLVGWLSPAHRIERSIARHGGRLAEKVIRSVPGLVNPIDRAVYRILHGGKLPEPNKDISQITSLTQLADNQRFEATAKP